MYQRIKNRRDAKVLLNEMITQEKNMEVGERILELVGVLDDAYGTGRTSKDMGGYILYFPDIESYENSIEDIEEFYNIEPEMYEYMERVGENKSESIQWIEKLFLLSSDDSLVLIYPQEVEC